MDRIYAPWRAVYLNKDQPDECLFCGVLKTTEDERAGVIHRGAHCFVIVNAYPYCNGHVMVVCNRHVERFHDLTNDEASELMELVARCEKAIMDDYKPGGINVGANLGKIAGAGVVGHLHMHLVPRWSGDTNFITAVGETRVISEDLAETYRRLKTYFP